MTRHLIILLIVSVLGFSGVLVSGCANNAETYALVGGVGGAVIGAVASGGGGAVVGACIGGGGGYIIGNEQDLVHH
ncbi:hypothetical protein ACFL1G_08825 [Planctomycetota bacterium]